MDTKEAVELIKKGKWFKRIALEHCPFISKMKTPPKVKHYQEITVRIPTDELTRFGKPKPQRRRFDFVSLVKPHYKAHSQELFSIGIEVKVSKSDLTGDKKYQDYLGYTDYLIFAVPATLVHEAKKKIAGDKGIGLLCIDADELLVLPELQTVSPENSSEIFKQIAFSK